MGIVSRVVQGFSKNRWSFAPLSLGKRGPIIPIIRFMPAAILSIIVLVIAPASKAQADEWSTTDKTLMGSLVAMQVIDVAQTKKVLRQGGYEMNPVFGKHPSDGVLVAGKLIGTGFIYWLVDTYPEYRTESLIAANALQLLVIRHNYVGTQVGLGF